MGGQITHMLEIKPAVTFGKVVFDNPLIILMKGQIKYPYARKNLSAFMCPPKIQSALKKHGMKHGMSGFQNFQRTHQRFQT